MFESIVTICYYVMLAVSRGYVKLFPLKIKAPASCNIGICIMLQ